ncbi:CinA family protein [Microbacterium sp.]|uniref:CinA family protein n=1 Tax=Microbacterium sp. TaxID=51671 RepID=UPI003F946992
MTTSPSTDIDRISELARTRHLRIAVVESLTSGALAHTVGAGEGASDWFAGGIVAYMTDVKQRLLTLEPGVDPCSAECAEQLAAGGLALFAADVCVATTGVGGPDPEDGHEPGTVYLGWATHDGVGHVPLQIDGGADAVLTATVAAASHLLRARAEEIGQPEHIELQPNP